MRELVTSRVFAELESGALPVGAFVVYMRLVAAGACEAPVELSNPKLHHTRRTAARSVRALAVTGHIKVAHVADESGAWHRFVMVKR